MSDLTLSMFCNAYVNRGGGGGRFSYSWAILCGIHYNATPSGTMFMGGGQV